MHDEKKQKYRKKKKISLSSLHSVSSSIWQCLETVRLSAGLPRVGLCEREMDTTGDASCRLATAVL
jgi:hypothetical protein